MHEHCEKDIIDGLKGQSRRARGAWANCEALSPARSSSVVGYSETFPSLVINYELPI